MVVICQSKPESLRWAETLAAAVKANRSHPQQQQQQQHVSVSEDPPYTALTRWIREALRTGRWKRRTFRVLEGLEEVKMRSGRARMAFKKLETSQFFLPIQPKEEESDLGSFSFKSEVEIEVDSSSASSEVTSLLWPEWKRLAVRHDIESPILSDAKSLRLPKFDQSERVRRKAASSPPDFVDGNSSQSTTSSLLIWIRPQHPTSSTSSIQWIDSVASGAPFCPPISYERDEFDIKIESLKLPPSHEVLEVKPNKEIQAFPEPKSFVTNLKASVLTPESSIEHENGCNIAEFCCQGKANLIEKAEERSLKLREFQLHSGMPLFASKMYAHWSMLALVIPPDLGGKEVFV